MLLNKCSFGCSAVYWLDKFLPASSEAKKIYHLPFTTGLVRDYKDEIDRFISIKDSSLDGIILDFTAEGPEKNRIKLLIDRLETAGVSKKQLFYIDSGLDYFDFCNHAISPNWISSYCDHPEIQNYNSLESRNTLFLVLARLPKFQRLKFVIKMLENKLDEISIISCGSGIEGDGIGDEQWFDQLVPAELRNRFPIILDDIRVDRHTASTNIDPRFKDCLINVVLESNYENNLDDPLGPPSHSWDRLFYTEKTDKCFFMEQIPLFLAKQGYVASLRNLGFDMFDDIINHSYDDIVDPYIRIEELANECVRLAHIGMPELLNTRSLTERLAANKTLPSTIKKRYLVEFEHKLVQWVEQL